MRQLASLDEILHLFKTGSSIVLHSGCAEPRRLAAELAQMAGQLQNITLTTMMPMGDVPYANGRLNLVTFFPGKGLRKAVNSGQARLVRAPLSRIPSYFTSGEMRADFLFLQVSEPDEAGQVSLGLSIDYMRAVLDLKPIIVAEINPDMPFTMGDSLLPLDRIDFSMPSHIPPQTLDPAPGDETDRRIADHVAGLIANGDILQAGIGALPDLVLGRLAGLSRLGIHSGIVTDAVRPLIEKGIVSGPSVTTMAGGTQDFYKFLHKNAAVQFMPCSVTHDFKTLAAIDRLCAINGILQIDLAANANAEMVGGKIVSSPGGLPDFALGASAAKGGKSILALRSCSKDGKESNILSGFDPATPMTLMADAIDYVVTEHGVARIRGLAASGRAKALASIAHPNFRADLLRKLP